MQGMLLGPFLHCMPAAMNERAEQVTSDSQVTASKIFSTSPIGDVCQLTFLPINGKKYYGNLSLAAR